MENLCPHYKKIFDRCKELKTQGEIKAVWSYNGTVQFKTEDRRDIRGTKVFHIDALEARFRTGRPIDPLRRNNTRTRNNNNNNFMNNAENGHQQQRQPDPQIIDTPPQDQQNAENRIICILPF